MTPTWLRLAPPSVAADDVLRAMGEVLVGEDQLHRSEDYPEAARRRLHEAGLWRLLVPRLDGGPNTRATVWHLGALEALVAAVDGSLAVTVGVNALALLPVYLAGSDALAEDISQRVRGGDFTSMLLTEIDRGSDLLRNRSRAEGGRLGDGNWIPTEPADAELFRLHGQKDLINGAERHELFTCFLRTGPERPEAPAGPFEGRTDFSLFVVPRHEDFRVVKRWPTLPAPAADISSVDLGGARISRDRLLGDIGEGFSIVQRTLAVSRGGISALASGAASQAHALALDYARTRHLKGSPLVGLGGIGEHLVRMASLDATVAALSAVTMTAVNAAGPEASGWTAAAKLLCCRLAEETVDEGRRVLSSRALLRGEPYTRLVGDVLLYGVFDGTQHLMMEELSWRLARAASRRRGQPAPEVGRFWKEALPAEPTPLARTNGRKTKVPDAFDTLASLSELEGEWDLEAAGTLAHALAEFLGWARKHQLWVEDQGMRFEAAMGLAELHGLAALVLIGDPGRRERLACGAPALDPELLTYAFRELGERAAARLLRLTERECPGADWEERLRQAQAWFRDGQGERGRALRPDPGGA